MLPGLRAELLGVELGNVSARRDGWELGSSVPADLDSWLNGFYQQWVAAARRISPALLIELPDLAARRFEEYVGTLDLDAVGRWNGRPDRSWAAPALSCAGDEEPAAALDGVKTVLG